MEGESAGGSAKMGRDRRFQAILPLKGKILNVERVLQQPDKIIGHEEIRSIIAALGAGEGNEFKPAQGALPQGHHHDRRRRGRLPHPHPAAHLFLPPDAGPDRRRLPLHRPTAPLPNTGGTTRSPIRIHRGGKGGDDAPRWRDSAGWRCSATRGWAR